MRALRQELGISQEELADRAGLHRNYIGSIERGERDIGLDSVAKVAAAFGLSLVSFFSPFDRVQRPSSGSR